AAAAHARQLQGGLRPGQAAADYLNSRVAICKGFVHSRYAARYRAREIFLARMNEVTPKYARNNPNATAVTSSAVPRPGSLLRRIAPAIMVTDSTRNKKPISWFHSTRMGRMIPGRTNWRNFPASENMSLVIVYRERHADSSWLGQARV